tara:strand:+ start:178 stop:789 length:612 start_codon:yes stop_codon:yes gene_type:complete
MRLFNKLFNKGEYNIKTENMSEEKDANVYVWQKSERIGKIVVEKETKDGWTYFTDGSRINPNLIDEFLSRATSMEEAENISKILSPVGTIKQAGAEESKKVKALEPIKEKVKNAFDPDEIMVSVLEKLSKKNKTKFDISLNVSIPSKTIIKALEFDVEEDELRRGLVKLVKKQINNIESQLNKEVENFIQKQYYEQTAKKKSI